MGVSERVRLRSPERSVVAAAASRPVDGMLAGLRRALGTGDGAADREVLRGVADWRAVARLATHHRVAALFLQGLRVARTPCPDAAVGRDLASRRQRDVARGLRQLAGMRRAVAGLAAQGIPALVLKGLPLGQRLYGDPFAKSSIDIDLLVPGDAFAAAGRTLRDLGWRRVCPDFRETPARRRWYDSVQKEHVYTGPGGTVELHRRLLGNRFLFDPPFASLDARAVTVGIGQSSFRTLGDVDLWLYLACHGSVHCWQRLKWLCDFAALIRIVDEQAVKEGAARARRDRLDSFVALALLLCRQALQVETPSCTTVSEENRPVTRLVAGLSRRAWTPRSGVGQVVRSAGMRVGRVFMGGGITYSLHEARSLLIGHRDFSKIDLPDRFFWFYGILRPVFWAAGVSWRAGRDARGRLSGGSGARVRGG